MTARLRVGVPHACHTCGMPRTRVSTTVDTDLLDQVRKQMPGAKDHALLDTALAALLAANRAAEVDASYAAYDEHPADEPDHWGDVAAWRQSAGRR